MDIDELEPVVVLNAHTLVVLSLAGLAVVTAYPSAAGIFFYEIIKINNIHQLIAITDNNFNSSFNCTKR